MYVWEKEITSNYHEVDVHFKTHSLSSNFTVTRKQKKQITNDVEENVDTVIRSETYISCIT